MLRDEHTAVSGEGRFAVDISRAAEGDRLLAFLHAEQARRHFLAHYAADCTLDRAFEIVGIRADIRYFRTLTDDNPGGGVDFDLGDLNFWKWDVGAAFKF